jgi:hypothetical protein
MLSRRARWWHWSSRPWGARLAVILLDGHILRLIDLQENTGGGAHDMALGARTEEHDTRPDLVAQFFRCRVWDDGALLHAEEQGGLQDRGELVLAHLPGEQGQDRPQDSLATLSAT